MAYRVVILAPQGELLPNVPKTSRAGVRYVYVSSGYEAAAELLAAATNALVVKLSSLTEKHLKLLDIARQRGVELLGMGSADELNADDLNGIKLTSPSLVHKKILALARRKSEQPKPTSPDTKLTPAKRMKRTKRTVAHRR